MSSIVDNTIFTPNPFASSILGDDNVFDTYLLDKRVGTGVLDQYGGASAAYSLYDLGNKRGTVVETGETVYGDFVLINRDTNNGGFETAGGGGADVFADWWEGSGGSSSVNRDTVEFDTGTASCRIDIDGSNSFGQVGQDVISPGKTYRYSLRAKASGSCSIRAGGSNAGDYDVLNLTTDWVTYTGEVYITAGSTSFLINRVSANGRSFWIDNVTLTELDTYRTLDVAYHNPAVRLRRDSDNIHKSFPAGAFTEMLNWANEDVVRISPTLNNGGFESWSAGKPSAPWNTAISGTSTITQETTGVYAGSSCVRGNIVESGSAGWIRIFDGLNGFNIGCRGRMSFYAKVGSGDSVRIRNIRYSDGHVGVTVTETGWTYFEFEWTQTSDTSVGPILEGLSGGETIWIDNLTFTQLTSDAYATTWYDQSGVQVESVFNDTDCSTANGWSQGGNTTLTVNYDSGDAGHESVFRAESGDGIADYIKLDDTYVDGTVYRLSFDHRYVTNSAVKGRIFVTGTQYGDITPSATWTRHELIWTQVGTGTSLRLFIDNNDGDASDEWLFDNIKVEVLDKAHNDAIQSTAARQPKVVDAGSLVTDANGNYAPLGDGVDDNMLTGDLSALTDAMVIIVQSTSDTDGALWHGAGGVSAGAGYAGVWDDGSVSTAIGADLGTPSYYADGSLQAWSTRDDAHTAVATGGVVVNTITGLNLSYHPTGYYLFGYYTVAFLPVSHRAAILVYPSSDNRSGIESVLSNTIKTALS